MPNIEFGTITIDLDGRDVSDIKTISQNPDIYTGLGGRFVEGYPITIETDGNGRKVAVQRNVSINVPSDDSNGSPYTPPMPEPPKTTTVDNVDITFSEFIRPKNISFSAKGLKPNTTVYPFFDGVNVSQYVTPTTLTTNSSGEVSGVFSIPLGKFTIGDRYFVLSDSETANPSQEYTHAEARYTAYGFDTPKTILNIPTPITTPVNTPVTTFKEGSPVINDPNAYDVILTPIDDTPTWHENFVDFIRAMQSPEAPAYTDPLAQTFFVDGTLFPEGIFISSVDLFFKTKDSVMPLGVQIRETVNGYPSSKVLSSVIFGATGVNVSNDCSDATNIQFPNVVYLAPGEYCLVILADSTKYEAWVGKIGENQIGTNKLITKQPYIGSLFKSQNSSTWTAEQTEDLAFKLYRCKFDTTTVGKTIFSDWDSTNITAENTVVINTTKPSTRKNTFDSYYDVNIGATGNIQIKSHPYNTGSAITYSMEGGATGIGLAESTNYYVYRVNSDIFRLYDTQANSIIGSTSAVGLKTTYNRTDITNQNHSFTGDIDVLYMDKLIYNSVNYGAEVTGATGFYKPTNVIGGSLIENSIIIDPSIDSVDIGEDTPLTFYRKSEGEISSNELMIPNSILNSFAGSSVNQFYKFTGQSDWTNISPNKNFNVGSTGLGYPVKTADESFKKWVRFSTNSEYVSPVINAERQSVVHVHNVVNNDSTGENSTSGGNSFAKYITRKATLAKDSTYLKVFLTANKPADTDIKVYYKVKSTYDSVGTFDDKNWTLMEQLSPSAATFSNNTDEFLEYEIGRAHV